jgi:hypothetical protein
MEEDLPLTMEGVLPLASLVCLHRGEWARDLDGALVPLGQELVKTAGTGERGAPWHCVFHEGNDCAIHDRAPAQCRLLQCRDTGPVAELLANGKRLTRKRILGAMGGDGERLWELAAAHEESCSIGDVLEDARRLGFSPGAPFPGRERLLQARRELEEPVRFDAAFRDLCRERVEEIRDVLPFLLGRPLAEMLKDVGLTFEDG